MHLFRPARKANGRSGLLGATVATIHSLRSCRLVTSPFRTATAWRPMGASTFVTASDGERDRETGPPRFPVPENGWRLCERARRRRQKQIDWGLVDESLMAAPSSPALVSFRIDWASWRNMQISSRHHDHHHHHDHDNEKFNRGAHGTRRAAARSTFCFGKT